MFDFFKRITRGLQRAKDFNNSGRIMSFLYILNIQVLRELIDAKYWFRVLSRHTKA